MFSCILKVGTEVEMLVSEPSRPSEWACERFGGAAQALLERIPAALHAAHGRALEAHVGLELKTNDAYGQIWHAHHQELLAQLQGVEGFHRRKPKRARYELAVIGNVVLYPWRYGDRIDKPVEDVRMDLSTLRRDLLALTPHRSDHDQLTLDQAKMEDDALQAEYEEIAETLRQMAEHARLVLVAYASNPHSGILSVKWGDVSLADDDGRLTWIYIETLPHNLGEGGGVARRGAPPLHPGPTPAESAPRPSFADGPLDDPVVTPRPSTTEPGSNPQKP
jgi:hypothetical protein